MPSCHSTVPSDRITGNAALMTLYPCCRMRGSLIGIQPSPGCTPLSAPSQFSQYPWVTLPAGRGLTGQVLPPDVPELEGDGDADAEGDVLGLCDGEALGEGEPPPV